MNQILTLSLCLVSSEMLPFGERSVGVGGVTVISGGNLETLEGMKSFGMLGGMRERIRFGSGSFECSLLAYGCRWSRSRNENVTVSTRSEGSACRRDSAVLTWARLCGAT